MWLKLPACLNGSGCCEMHPSIEPSIRPLAFARCTLSSKHQVNAVPNLLLKWPRTWTWTNMNQIDNNNNKNSCHFDKRERHETEPKTINEKLRAREVVRLRETVCERERHYQTKSFCLYRTQRICYGTIISTESFCSRLNIAPHKIEQPMNKLSTNQMMCEKERVEEKSQRQCFRRTQLNKIYELIFRTLLYFCSHYQV